MDILVSWLMFYSSKKYLAKIIEYSLQHYYVLLIVEYITYRQYENHCCNYICIIAQVILIDQQLLTQMVSQLNSSVTC